MWRNLEQNVHKFGIWTHVFEVDEFERGFLYLNVTADFGTKGQGSVRSVRGTLRSGEVEGAFLRPLLRRRV